MKKILILFLAVSFLSSCNKKRINELQREIELKDEQIELLEENVRNLQQTNSSILDRMADLSIVNKDGAQSIKKSLENINQQYGFIQDLTTKIQSKDSLNLALVMNLKKSLANVNDEDVQIEVRGGVVYVSISDKMLFNSGSSKVTSRAKEVLGKVARVINDQNEVDVMVEGHTDNVPIGNSCIKDNWDLSVKRATSVVRILEQEYFVDPMRLTAAGRSEFLPVADNASASGRSLNRRTDIILTPKLDQFFKLLEAPPLAD